LWLYTAIPFTGVLQAAATSPPVEPPILNGIGCSRIHLVTVTNFVLNVVAAQIFTNLTC